LKSMCNNIHTFYHQWATMIDLVLKNLVL